MPSSPASESLEAALNTLSRALEDNSSNAEIWCHYLTLFSRRGSWQEVQEMCEMAVENAPDPQVWWRVSAPDDLYYRVITLVTKYITSNCTQNLESNHVHTKLTAKAKVLSNAVMIISIIKLVYKVLK